MTLTKIASTGVEDSLRWVLGANGTSDYTFTGPGLTGTVNDPTIYLTRGQTYIFQNNSGGHPFYIKTSIANGGTNDAYNTGVTNNGGGNGTEIVFTVPHDSPDILYYQCSSHASMAGQFNIAGSVADGSISTAKLADDAVNNDKLANSVVAAIAANTAKTTNATHTGDVTGSTSLTIANNAVTNGKIVDGAVTTTKIADSTSNTDGITTAKIATGAVTTAKLATDAVDNSKLADQAVTLDKLPHGTSSNDGKFLRANNGADPTFESIPAGTTINNNADDRVITGGSGTTLNAESNMTYASNTLKLQDAANDTSLLHIVGQGTATRGLKIGTSRATGASNNDGAAVYDAIDSESNAYGAQHRFKIAGTDCFTIGYNGDKGYVGIQEGVPYPDAVGGAGVASHLQLGVPTGQTDKATSIKLIGRDGSANGNKCQIQWSGAHNRFDITVNGNQALQIQANKDVEVTDGDLVIGTSGHGISFAATANTSASNATMQNELLADYEKGEWYPVIRFYNNGTWSDASMTSQGTRTGCSYVKIGNMCFFHLGWDNFEVSNSSYAVIGGLPFQSNGRGAVLVTYTNLFNNLQDQGGHISGSTEQIEFYRSSNNWNSFQNNQSGRYIYADGFYQCS